MTKEKESTKQVEKDQTAFTFSKKQIRNIQLHSDPNKIDNLTQQRMIIAQVRIPSKSFRTYSFGNDSNGINLDEREGFINVPASAIHLNLKNIETGKYISPEEAKHVMLGLNDTLIRKSDLQDVTNQYTLSNCYLYADHNRDYTVNFKGKVIHTEHENEGQAKVTKVYDKPDKIKIKGDVLAKMYNDCSDLAKENRKKEILKDDKVKEQAKSRLKSKKTKAKKQDKSL